MKYIEIKKLLEQNNIKEIDTDIVVSVKSALYDDKISDELFNEICSYTRAVWDKVDKGYTQLVADIVCDCLQDCGYGYRSKLKLTKRDLQQFNKIDKVVDIFYDKYWED